MRGGRARVGGLLARRPLVAIGDRWAPPWPLPCVELVCGRPALLGLGEEGAQGSLAACCLRRWLQGGSALF